MADAAEDFDDLDLDDLDLDDNEEDIPSNSGKGKLIGIALACLVGGGVGGWLYAAPGDVAQDPAAEEGQKDGEKAGSEAPDKATARGPVVELETFIVNLKTSPVEELRYLKCKIALELAADEHQATFEARRIKTRHVVLLFLSSLTVADTQGAENKRAIQVALRDQVATVLGAVAVTHVYLTEFVIQ